MRRTLLVVLAAVVAWFGTRLPRPWGTADRAALSALRWPVLAVLLVLLALWAAWLALRAKSDSPLDMAIVSEEPLLRPAHMPSCRSPRPVVFLAGLGPGAGVSTLTFNLAVSLAVDGRCGDAGGVRACRPVCLLGDGPLAASLGLSPRPLAEYVATRPHRVDADLVNLAVRHTSGCELLCLGSSAGSLALLVAELGTRYDAVLVDGALGERPVVDAVTDLGDALLLVGLSGADAVQAAGRWIERVWALGLEGRTALLVNRVVAHPMSPRELELAFLYGAELPDDPGLPDLDRLGLPWSLDRRLPISRRVAEVTAQLFPALVKGAGADAA